MSNSTRPSKLRFARYGFMGASTCFTIGTLLVVFLQTGSIGLKVTNAAAALASAVYIPAALWIALRQVESTFDHAGGEIAFLSILSALWAASSVLGGVTGGPGICHTALYDSGRLANSFPGHHIEIDRIARECRALTSITALSVIHTVLIVAWIALDVYLVYSASSSSSSISSSTGSGSGMTRGQGFKLPMWKLSRGVYAQVGQSDMGEVPRGFGNGSGTASANMPPMATPMKAGWSGYTAQHHHTSTPQRASPVNPFGSTYEVDSAGPFDNPFDRTPTRSSRR